MNRRLPVSFRWTRLAGAALLALATVAAPAATNVPPAAVTLLAPTAVPSARTADPSSLFALARQAYDAGRFDEAAQVYDRLIADGYVGAEVLFNAGNAKFRAGRVGPAILAYRQAWRLAPSDPDLDANLNYALAQAGAPQPQYGRILGFFLRHARDRWYGIARTGYFIAALLLAVGLWWRTRRGTFVRLAGIAALAALLGLAGTSTWMWFDRSPEVVVLAQGRNALFAPLPQATPHYATPEGTILRVAERQGDWSRVQLGPRVGWMKTSDLSLVTTTTK